jgi:hypothetical protein
VSDKTLFIITCFCNGPSCVNPFQAWFTKTTSSHLVIFLVFWFGLTRRFLVPAAITSGVACGRGQGWPQATALAARGVLEGGRRQRHPGIAGEGSDVFPARPIQRFEPQSCRRCLSSVRGRRDGRHLMVSDKDRPANLMTRDKPCGAAARDAA